MFLHGALFIHIRYSPRRSIMGVLSEEVLTLRTATIDDLDDLADIACAAFPMDPQWVYRFPHRKEYPEDHWICTRLRYKNMIGRDDTAINVITIPTKKDEETIHRPIALAVWELPGGEAGIIFPSGSYFHQPK